MKRRLFVPLLLAVVVGLPTPAATAAPPDRIRVRLLDDQNPREVRVEAGETLALYAGLDPLPLVTLAAGESVRLVADEARLKVEAPGMTFYTPQLRLGGETAADADVAFTLHGPSGSLTRQYQGTLRADLDGAELRLIHAVDLETYVAAVVTREYGLPDDEGTRAMAILARTYALYTRGTLHPDYDVVDHVGSQVFHGLDGVSDRARAAAEATRGQVLTWNGELARAVYSSSNGGHSASNQEVWAGDALPYLQARPDPYDDVSPHSTWRTTLNREQVLRALSSAFGAGVSGFVIDERSAEGRVTRITLQRDRGRSETVTGQQFRMTLSARFGVRSIRSTLFDAKREGDAYVFEGRGFGHGVGMSQWGAHGQAQQGRTAEEILAFYYPGTRISPLEAGTAPALSTREPAIAAGEPPANEAAMPDPAEPLPPVVEPAAQPRPTLTRVPQSVPAVPEPVASEPVASERADRSRPEGWTGPRSSKNPPSERRGW